MTIDAQHLPRERKQQRKVLDLDVWESSLRCAASARRCKLAANSTAPRPFYKAIDRGQPCPAAGMWLAADSLQSPSRMRAAPLVVSDRGTIPAPAAEATASVQRRAGLRQDR